MNLNATDELAVVVQSTVEGRLCSAIVMHMFPNTDTICSSPFFLKDEHLDRLLNKHVIFCGITIKDYQLKKLRELSCSITFIENKSSSVIKINDLMKDSVVISDTIKEVPVDGYSCPVISIINFDKSIVSMLWSRVHGDIPMPVFVDYVDQYMTWDFRNEEAMWLHRILELNKVQFSINEHTWLKWLKGDLYDFHTYLEHGKSLDKYCRKQYDYLMKSLAFDTTVCGYTATAINVKSGFNSTIAATFNTDNFTRDFLILFQYSDTNQIKVTIFKHKNSKACLSDVCAKFNGGNRNEQVGGYSTPNYSFIDTFPILRDRPRVIGSQLIEPYIDNNLNNIKYVENVQGANSGGSVEIGEIMGYSCVAKNSHLVTPGDWSKLSKELQSLMVPLRISYVLTNSGYYRVIIYTVDNDAVDYNRFLETKIFKEEILGSTKVIIGYLTKDELATYSNIGMVHLC